MSRMAKGAMVSGNIIEVIDEEVNIYVNGSYGLWRCGM